MKLKTEIIDTQIEGIDDSKYIYLLCPCPTPVTIVHRALRPTKPGYYSTVCPKCKAKIGINIPLLGV